MEKPLISIDAIVLAAGRSSRMGSPKSELEIEPGLTFLERAVNVLRAAGCRYVVAVVGKEGDWAARLADVAGAAVVINDLSDSEQIDSVRLGLAHLPEDSAGALVLPVDLPRIQESTVRGLIDAFVESGHGITLPTHGGVGGHPVLFARAVFPDLHKPDLPRGAESVVDLHAENRRVLEVDDAGILFDVDTPEDYERINRDG